MSELDIHPLSSWSGAENRPLIIAGPCSAETEEQMMTIGKAMAEQHVDVVRAGIWKPRTRPNAFEGVGEDGLKWLKALKDQYGFKVGTEVANPQHIELALKNDIDVLWIGARTTVSPFAIQEMADALAGMDNVPVLVKNPINPDLGLWIGAIERFHRAGVRKLGAIHRGFSTYEKTRYRNKPMWQLAIEFRSKMPNVPIICDPSHIGGDRGLIAEVSQRAMDLGLDGLMIETHPDPDNAWSDASQQVTPKRLGEILHDLKIRRATSDDVEFLHSLEDLREKIDGIDAELIEVLAARTRIAEKIGEYKKSNNVTTLQLNRWDAILADRAAKAQAMGVDPEFVGEIYKLIHKESIRVQSEIMNDENVDA